MIELGVGDIASLLIVCLSLVGGILNVRSPARSRYYSFIIWAVGNALGAILYYLAYIEVVQLTLGLLLFAVLNVVYTAIDIVGVYNTKRELA